MSELFQFRPFQPHENFHSGINNAICESELNGGVNLNDLPIGAVLEIGTAHHQYLLENKGDGKVLISGHPVFCPKPLLADLQGSTWGTAMLKWRFIGRGMKMELIHPVLGTIVTSAVREIREQVLGTRRKAS
jgi:hypothetical protein